MVNTPNKGYTQQLVGSNVNVWGLVVNEIFGDIDTNLAGGLSKTLSSGTVGLTANESKNVFHTLSGTLTGNVIYEFPDDVGGFFFIKDQTTRGSYNIRIRPTGGSGFLLNENVNAIVRVDADAGTATLIMDDTASDDTRSLGQVQFNSDIVPAYSLFESTTDIIYIQTVYGQSGGEGVMTAPAANPVSDVITTATVYSGYALAPLAPFASGTQSGKPWRTPGQVNDAFVTTPITAFTNLYEYEVLADDADGPGEHLTETPNSSLVNQFIKEVDEALGETPTVVVLNGSVGGTTYLELKRGSDPYQNLMEYAAQVVDLIKAQNKTPFFLPIFYFQGTADTTAAQVTDRRMFAENDARMQRDLDEDLRALSGQKVQVPLCIVQTRSFPTTDSDNAYYLKVDTTNVPSMGEVFVSQTNPLVILMAPSYQVSTSPVVGLHPDAPGYLLMGTQAGHIIANIFLGGEWAPLIWNPEETHWVDSQTLQLQYRVPRIRISNAIYTGSITNDVLTVTGGLTAGEFVIVGQSLSGSGIPVASETVEATIVIANITGNGGTGTYRVRGQNYDGVPPNPSPTGSITITAVSAFGNDRPAYYIGELVIDSSGSIVSTAGIETSCGFTAVDTMRRYVDPVVPITSVSVYRPSEDMRQRFIRIRFAYRPSGPILLSYATKVPTEYTVETLTITNAGAGCVNGTNMPLTFSGGGSPVVQAVGTYTVSGGIITSVAFRAADDYTNCPSGIPGGLYLTETAPTVGFSAAVAGGAAVTATVGSISGDGPDYGSRGLIRDNLPNILTSDGQICYNHACNQAQWVPAPPEPVPNLLKNGQGLVYTGAPGTDILSGTEGHNDWIANVQAGGYALATSTVDSDGEAFMVLSKSTTSDASARRLAYIQFKNYSDTVGYRGQTVALSGRLARSDADGDFLLGIAGWTGAANAMPATLFNTSGYGSTAIGPSCVMLTASIPSLGSVMTVTTITSGSVTLGAAVSGGSTDAGTVVINQLTGSAGSTGTYTVTTQTVAGIKAPTDCTALYVSNASVVAISAETTDVEMGVKTDAFVVQAEIPSNVNNIALYVLVRDTIITPNAVSVALKLEVGNTGSGLPFTTAGDVEDELGIQDSVVNVMDFGAYCDTQLITSIGSCTAASTTVNTGTRQVPSNMIGQPIVFPQSGAAPFYPQNSVTVTAGGTAYTVGDVLVVAGGTVVTPAQVTVSAISGGGATGPVTDVRWASKAAYGTGYSGTLPTNPNAVTGGTGANCTLTFAWVGQALATTISATGGTGPSNYTITVASAPSVTQSAIPVWAYGHNDAAAWAAAVAYVQTVRSKRRRIFVPGNLGTASVLALPVSVGSGVGPHGDPGVIGSGVGASAIIALGTMTNLVARAASPASRGGGMQNITVNGMGLCSGSVVRVAGGTGASYLNFQALNGVGASANACFSDSGANDIKVLSSDFRMDPYFSGAMMPDYNLLAGGEAGQYSQITAVNAAVANVASNGGGRQMAIVHTFSSGGVAPPTYGLQIDSTGTFTNIQIDGAITAEVQIDHGQVYVAGVHLGNGNGAISPTYGVRIASNMGSVTVTGVRPDGSWNGTSANIVYQDGTASATTQAFGNNGASYVALNIPIAIPQGRLSLSSSTPVMAADVTAGTTVYYLPYTGGKVPTFNGILATGVRQNLTYRNIGAGISLPLDSAGTGAQLSGNIYDLFIYANNSGTVRIGTGPAWTTAPSGTPPSGGTRGAGAGTTEIVRETNSGIWVNTVSIDLHYGTANGDIDTVAANLAVYLGSMYATANGQCAMVFAPAAAAGGNGNYLALYNAYNKVSFAAVSRSTDAAQVGTAAWRQTNGDAANFISWLDGLADVSVAATTRQYIDSDAASALIGVGVDWAAGAPADIGAGPTAIAGSTTVVTQSAPLLGNHNVKSLENGSAADLFGNGSGYQSLTVQLNY